MHVAVYPGQSKFCKRCEIFIPNVHTPLTQGGSAAIREEGICKKNNINPNTEYRTMISKQAKNRCYYPTSASLAFRKDLIQDAQKIAFEHHLSAATLYCSICYLDTILSNWEVTESNAYNIMLVCLLLATKFYETCDMGAKARHIYSVCKEEIGKSRIMGYESSIAGALEWEFDL